MTNAATWKTKDGKVIPISMMTDSHLINTISYIRRNARQIAINNIRRGYGIFPAMFDDAFDDMEEDLSYLDESTDGEILEDYVPIYSTMLWHAKRRKLKDIHPSMHHTEKS